MIPGRNVVDNFFKQNLYGVRATDNITHYPSAFILNSMYKHKFDVWFVCYTLARDSTPAHFVGLPLVASLKLNGSLTTHFIDSFEQTISAWDLLKSTLRLSSFGPGHAKMCLMLYANKKGADQPAHPRSLISTFVVRCLDIIMALVSISEISRV